MTALIEKASAKAGRAERKSYDPYQPVELQASTSSMEGRMAAVLGTAKPFSGAVWYARGEVPIAHLVTGQETNDASMAMKDASGTLLGMMVPQLKDLLPPVPVPKPTYSEVPRFVSLQKWECSVLEVSKDSFTARLIDLTHDESDEEAEFPLDEVPQSDLLLLKPGAVFYWNIGYEDSLTGQRTRVSTMRFRRLPVWRKEELDSARKEARKLGDKLGWK